MYLLIALLVLGFSGDPAADEFEGWTPPRTELSTGEVRVIGNYSTRPHRDAAGVLEYYVLEDPPQITLRARGPAYVILKILGHETGRVKIGLDLDAAMMVEEVVQVFESLPTELFLSVPAGRHMIAFSASSRVLLGVQTAGRAPTRSDRIIAWGSRDKGEQQPVEPEGSDSSFWRYKPDLSNFEFKDDGPASPWSFWVNAGVGPSVNMESSTSGLGFGGSANLRYDHYLMQFRSTYNLELTVMGPEPQESLWEVSPMFGFVLKGRVGWISAAAGVGLVGGVGRGKLIEQGQDSSERDKYEEVDFLDIGFPIDIQLFLKPPSFLMFGLGLNIYANLGPSNSVVGLMLSIMAGS